MGTFDKVPLTGGKSYYNKQEGDWWQQANLPERLDDDYSEMAWFSRERITRTNIRVSYMHVLHIRPIPLIAARIPIQIVPSRSTN
jgi:hypothetical protein